MTGTSAPARAEVSTVTVYMPRAWKQQVKVHCAQQGVTISDYALALIAQDLRLK